MMYDVMCKASKEMVADVANIITYLKKSLVPPNEKGKKFIRHGGIKIFDQHSDDFIKNLVTVVQRYEVYKKPRFIK